MVSMPLLDMRYFECNGDNDDDHDGV